MTKIKEKSKHDEMRSHIQDAYAILDEHLPDQYVQEVQKKLPINSGITAGIIRNIRNNSSRVTDNKLFVLTALVEVAKENKEIKENFISTLQ